MLDTLRVLIADSLPAVPDLEPPIQPADIRVAACALLLEVAFADDHFSRDERSSITKSLVTYFGVDERGAMELLETAEAQLAREGNDASFLRQVTEEYDDSQKLMLADMIWQVARADGWPDGHEAFMAEKLEKWLGGAKS